MKQKSICSSPWLSRFSLFFILFFLFSNVVFSQTTVVKGTVTDAQGKALEGANISVRGATNGTITDATGKYSITVPENDVLIFSFAGFKEQVIPVKNQTIVNVSLTPEINSLEEVIVTGYRSQTRGSVDGSVSSVNSKEFIDVPVDNISNALAGRLSGVTITQGSGTPGMQSDIRIRASGTYNNADPLYVIDGIVSDKFTFDGLTADQIEDVTVLKDGASAAIYGSRAANGVVLVTTKRGKAGSPVLSYTGLYGFQNPTKIPKTLNAYEHASAINLQLNYINADPNDARYYTPDELDYFKTHSWNWMDELWQNPASTQHTLDVSGGTDKVKYFLGGSYNYSTGSFNNLDYSKYTLKGQC